MSHAKTRRQAAEQTQAELQTQLNRLKAQQKSEPLRRAQLEALRTAIPDQPNLAQFILDVNDAAAKAGIDFVSISPSPPAAPAAPAAAAAAPGERRPRPVPPAPPPASSMWG